MCAYTLHCKKFHPLLINVKCHVGTERSVRQGSHNGVSITGPVTWDCRTGTPDPGIPLATSGNSHYHLTCAICIRKHHSPTVMASISWKEIQTLAFIQLIINQVFSLLFSTSYLLLWSCPSTGHSYHFARSCPHQYILYHVLRLLTQDQLPEDILGNLFWLSSPLSFSTFFWTNYLNPVPQLSYIRI